MSVPMVTLLFWVGVGLLGCGPAHSAGDALPADYVGATAVIDICNVDPCHPDCVGQHAPVEVAAAGLSAAPQLGQTFDDPLGRFSFDFPAGWHATTTLVDGVVLLDAPDREQATRWVELWPANNPEQASIAVWVAENGLPWPGQVTQQGEDWISGVPVLRQRLENQDPNSGGPYVYALVWRPLGDHLLLWTAWPGDDPEMLELLERINYAFCETR